jgi:hypothetical protein
MSESTTYEGWAILELMGHRRLIGRVSEATIAGSAMLRIDVLTKDGEATQYYGGGAIYALTPTTEAMARRAASLSTVAPITRRWELLAPAAVDMTALRAAALAPFVNRGDHEEPLPFDSAMSALAALLSGSAGVTTEAPGWGVADRDDDDDDDRGLEAWGE